MRGISTAQPTPDCSLWKKKTLQYQFSVQYCPGKWQHGTDFVSHYPYKDHVSFLDLIHTDLSTNGSMTSYATEQNTSYLLSTIDTLNKFTSSSKLSPEKPTRSIILEQIKDASCYQALIHQIKHGFPQNKNNTDPSLHPFWEVWHQITTSENVILMDGLYHFPSKHKFFTSSIQPIKELKAWSFVPMCWYTGLA